MILDFICSFAIAASLGICAPASTRVVGYVEGEYVRIGPIDTARIETVAVRRGERVAPGALLVWALRGVHLGEVVEHLRNARPGPLLLAVIIATTTYPLRLVRWRFLLRDALSWPVVMLAMAALAYWAGGARLALFTAAGMLLIGLLGMWEHSMDTLSQVIVTMLFTAAVAIPLGVLASQSRAFADFLRGTSLPAGTRVG